MPVAIGKVCLLYPPGLLRLGNVKVLHLANEFVVNFKHLGCPLKMLESQNYRAIFLVQLDIVIAQE